MRKAFLKDPYIFDMLTFTDEYNERDVEIGLVKHVEQFLVEMERNCHQILGRMRKNSTFAHIIHNYATLWQR